MMNERSGVPVRRGTERFRRRRRCDWEPSGDGRAQAAHVQRRQRAAGRTREHQNESSCAVVQTHSFTVTRFQRFRVSVYFVSCVFCFFLLCPSSCGEEREARVVRRCATEAEVRANSERGVCAKYDGMSAAGELVGDVGVVGVRVMSGKKRITKKIFETPKHVRRIPQRVTRHRVT